MGEYTEGHPARTGILELRSRALTQLRGRRRETRGSAVGDLQRVQPRDVGESKRDLRQPELREDHVNRRRTAHHAVRGEVRVLARAERGQADVSTSVFHVHLPLRFTRTRLTE